MAMAENKPDISYPLLLGDFLIGSSRGAGGCWLAFPSVLKAYDHIVFSAAFGLWSTQTPKSLPRDACQATSCTFDLWLRFAEAIHAPQKPAGVG